MGQSLPVCLLAITVAAVLLSKILGKRSPRLPPGPPKLPIVENVFDIPSNFDSSVFSKMSEQYGEPNAIK